MLFPGLSTKYCLIFQSVSFVFQYLSHNTELKDLLARSYEYIFSLYQGPNPPSPSSSLSKTWTPLIHQGFATRQTRQKEEDNYANSPLGKGQSKRRERGELNQGGPRLRLIPERECSESGFTSSKPIELRGGPGVTLAGQRELHYKGGFPSTSDEQATESKR